MTSVDKPAASAPVDDAEPEAPAAAGEPAEASAQIACEPTSEERFELVYDLPELRRRIEVSFTAGELSKFAERLRIFTDREGSTAKGAKTLVRAMQVRGRVDDLVQRLAAHRPLLEWPEPQRVAVTEPLSTPPEPVEQDEPSVQLEELGPQLDPPPSPAIRRGLLLAGMLVLGALLGALGSGLLAPSPASGPKPAAGRVELAELAAAHLGRAVAAVTRACRAEDTSASARDALTSAFRNCAGPSQATPGRRLRDPLLPDPLLPDPLLRAPRRRTNAPPVMPRSRPRPVDNGRRCLERCNQTHTACKRDRCGPEPVAGRKQIAFRRCMSSCLTDNSKCRMRCP